MYDFNSRLRDMCPVEFYIQHRLTCHAQNHNKIFRVVITSANDLSVAAKFGYPRFLGKKLTKPVDSLCSCH